METEQKTVFVGLSGGVDSSVAAARLKERGFNVVGVFIKVWHPDFLDCNWEAERLDAMRVAAHLDIPFLMCDATEAYKNEVAKYFIDEYKAGRTPNPDVMCNKAVKFGAFLDFALERGADYVATGHYAQSIKNAAGEYELHRGVDHNKDQSYFLWTLTQDQLKHILFPVGDTVKEEIRKEASKYNIPVAAKKDSQGVCFLGHIDIPEFLGHYVDLVPGDVLNEEGKVIGTHKGALVYTNGQRHGFEIITKNITESAHYVVDRDIEANTITVDAVVPTTAPQTECVISSLNYIVWNPEKDMEIQVQTRYRQRVTDVVVSDTDDVTLSVRFTKQHEVHAVGQSCVFYEHDRCLGGGIIS